MARNVGGLYSLVIVLGTASRYAFDYSELAINDLCGWARNIPVSGIFPAQA
jgi:hypothetical protein